jgi:hypothetical protein
MAIEIICAAIRRLFIPLQKSFFIT